MKFLNLKKIKNDKTIKLKYFTFQFQTAHVACCPVFTVAAGILLGDLKGSNWRETMGVVGSIFLFVGALVLLTLASAEPEE